MRKENTVLIGAIIISLIIIFVGGSSSGITGNATLENSKTSIIITPEVASSGEIIHVTVIPGKDGVNEKTSFYQAEDDLRKTSVSRLCNNYKCVRESSFSFVIPTSWDDGVYYIKVYDYEIKDFIIEDFTIRN